MVHTDGWSSCPQLVERWTLTLTAYRKRNAQGLTIMTSSCSSTPAVLFTAFMSWNRQTQLRGE